jgi:hypothetical protein
MSQFKPLTLDLIEEGDFLKAVNEALLDVQRQLLEVVGRYGAQACSGMKAGLTVSIGFKMEDMGDRTFSIAGDIRKTVPTRPKVHTVGLSDQLDDGRPALFVRATGSSIDDPRQGLLFPSEEPQPEAAPPLQQARRQPPPARTA